MKALSLTQPWATLIAIGAKRIAYWTANAGGAAEAAMLGALIDIYPGSMTRDELATASNYSVTSRHVDNTISRLRTLELVAGDRSALKASDELFD